MLKQRDYSNLKETVRVKDAEYLNSTSVKDYSLDHDVTVSWKFNDFVTENHLALIDIDGTGWMGTHGQVSVAVMDFINGENEDGWLPVKTVVVDGYASPPLQISTVGVNQECLRDSIARVTIGNNCSIIDLEELLKATRYA